MSKAYKVTRHTIKFNKDNIHDVFSVQPVSYGLLTTDDVANQIAAESSATPGDVKNVRDRYAHYVKQNLKKGYSIELLGFGKLDIRFVKSGTVDDEKKATAALVKGMIPDFSPSFKIVNGKRIYDLMPEKISLVKYTGVVPPNNTTEETPTETPGGSGDDSDLGN